MKIAKMKMWDTRKISWLCIWHFSEASQQEWLRDLWSKNFEIHALQNNMFLFKNQGGNLVTTQVAKQRTRSLRVGILILYAGSTRTLLGLY